MGSERFDLVVVGCGVAVLERAPLEERGGQSQYTEAYLRMKSHTEVSDDFEEHLAENGAGYVDSDLIAETVQADAPGGAGRRYGRGRTGDGQDEADAIHASSPRTVTSVPTV